MIHKLNYKGDLLINFTDTMVKNPEDFEAGEGKGVPVFNSCRMKSGKCNPLHNFPLARWRL
jgi:hypothetical protein